MGGPFERRELRYRLREAAAHCLVTRGIRQRASGSEHQAAGMRRGSSSTAQAAPGFCPHLTAVAAVKVRAFGHSAVELHQPIGTVMVAGEFC